RHRVTGTAELGFLDVVAVNRFDPGRVVHGVRSDFVILVRTIDFVGRTKVKVARRRGFEEVFEVWTFVVVSLGTRLHAMTDHATDPVTSERTMHRLHGSWFVVSLGAFDGEHVLKRKLSSLILRLMELLMPHRTMAAQAGIGHRLLQRVGFFVRAKLLL